MNNVQVIPTYFSDIKGNTILQTKEWKITSLQYGDGNVLPATITRSFSGTDGLATTINKNEVQKCKHCSTVLECAFCTKFPFSNAK